MGILYENTLKAQDLEIGKEVAFAITDVGEGTFKTDDDKLIKKGKLILVSPDKEEVSFILNVENRKRINVDAKKLGLTGDEELIGLKLVLTAEMVEYKKKKVAGIRVVRLERA